ncbi:MAG: hypothetical protein R2755_04650 [Acidimicrobiales bacterium]
MSSASSTGGPVRTLADASSKPNASTEVAATSFVVLGRSPARRPGTMCSTMTSSALAFSAGSVTSRAVPNSTTDR